MGVHQADDDSLSECVWVCECVSVRAGVWPPMTHNDLIYQLDGDNQKLMTN